MTPRSRSCASCQQEDLNFLLTNRLPRRWLTLFTGWLSRWNSRWCVIFALRMWRLFSDLDLSEARTTHFEACTSVSRAQLKEGARPVDVDPDAAGQSCDAIIGAMGQVDGRIGIAGEGLPIHADGSARR